MRYREAVEDWKYIKNSFYTNDSSIDNLESEVRKTLRDALIDSSLVIIFGKGTTYIIVPYVSYTKLFHIL